MLLYVHAWKHGKQHMYDTEEPVVNGHVWIYMLISLFDA